MGWWSLGAEDTDDSSAGSSSAGAPVTRGGRGRGRGLTGGRVSTGRMAARGRGRGSGADAAKKAEEEASLFTSIGRMVNTLAGVDDETTVASAKYQAQPKGAAARTNADEAQRRANEMANAMAWLNAGAEEETPASAAPSPGSGLFTGGDNWWENEESSVSADDMSLFSNATDFKTQDAPDLMALLKQKQEENAKRRAADDKSVGTAATFASRKGKGTKLSSKEAVERVNRMASALQWWNSNVVDASGSDGSPAVADSAEMKRVMEWWAANPDYLPPTAKGFDKDKRKAMKIDRALNVYSGKPELTAEAKARELMEAVQWWQDKGQDHVKEARESEYNQATFKRVNDLFGGWELKGLPQPEWTKFNPRANPEEAIRRATDLQACLELVTSGRFEQSHPHYLQAMNRVKDLMVDWQLQEDNSATELEAALSWWNMNAHSYDPLIATGEEASMFRKCRTIMSKFGFKEGDDLDSRAMSMKKALALWAKHKDTPIEQLDAYTQSQMKMVKQALLQLKRDQLQPETMKVEAQKLAKLMEWYRSDGKDVTDLDDVSTDVVAKFRQAEGLLKLWGYKVDPTPEQLKQIADSLIFFRRNGYKPEIFDQYDGEEGAKFRRLQQAMMDWRLSNAESSEFVGDEADGVAREIDAALNWWCEEGEKFDPQTALTPQLFSADKVKLLVTKWKPTRSVEQSFTWKRAKKDALEIQEAINLWRDNGKTFDVDSIKLKPKERQLLMKLKDAMLEWRRHNASNLSEMEAEQTVKDMINAMNWWKKKGKDYDAVDERLEAVPAMMRHKVVSDTLADWHRDMGLPEHDFKHLSSKEAKKIAADVADSLSWWERSGKDMDLSQDLLDQENFVKAQRLAQFWQQQTMGKKEREKAAEEISQVIRWVRSKSKDFHLEDVSDERAGHLDKLFQVWGTKGRKPKAVAKEIEDSISWWKRNQFSVDTTGKIPADAEKMKKLDQLAKAWFELQHPNQEIPDAANMGWFRDQMLSEIQDSLESFEQQPEAKMPSTSAPMSLSEEQQRAQQMASALDWLRNNDAELDVDDDISVAMSLASFKKIDSLMPKSADDKGPTEMSAALDWLRTKTDVDEETVNSFRKIDNVLQKTGLGASIKESGFSGALDWLRQRQAEKADGAIVDDESNASGKHFHGVKPKSEAEKRAEAMASALDWITNDALEDMPDDISLGLGSVGSFRPIEKMAQDAKADETSALDWLRKQREGKPGLVRDDESAKSGSVAGLPVRPMSAEEKRVNEMSDALAWLRKNATSTDDIDDNLSLSSTFSRFTTSKGATADNRELDNALAWLSKKNPDNLESIDDSDFSTLSGLPFVPKTKEQLKAAQMGKALDWLRGNGAAFDGDVPDFSDYSTNFSGVDTQGLDAENRAQEMAKALDWLTNKDPDTLEDMDDPFAKVGMTGPTSKSKEQLKAEAMNKALGWLRNKGDDDFDDAPNFDSYGLGDSFNPVGDEAGDRASEMAAALDWLRGRSNDESDDKFQKLDKVLPKKDGQSAEDRAKDMEDALAWLRSNGLDLDGDETPIESFDKLGVSPIGFRSQQERDSDRLKALSWLRNKQSGFDDYDTSGFADLDELVPRREGQSVEDRAAGMEHALAWLRANGLEVDGDDGTPSFEKIGAIDSAPRSQEARESDLNEALNWLRGSGTDDESDSLFAKLNKFIGSPASDQSQMDRARDMENALNWLHQRGVNVDDLDEPDFESFSPFEDGRLGVRSSVDQKSEDEAAALTWLRNGKDSKLDPTGVFTQLDDKLPRKKKQTKEKRARDIANALVWMRNRGLVPGAEEEALPFEKIGDVSVGHRSAEDRANDMEAALNWLKNKGAEGNEYDPEGVFQTLDETMPRKADQSLEQRAKDIESALNWMRTQNLDVHGGLESASPFEAIAGSSHGTRSPEERAKDMENALNWLRNKGQVGDDTLFDPTGVFKKLDSSLPQKAGQSPEDRAKDLENALAWMREKGLVADDRDLGIPDFEKADIAAFAQRSPEESAAAMQDALNWLRNKNVAEADPSGMYTKLDSMLPHRKGQSAEDRATEMVNALNWLRRENVTTDEFDFGSLPGVDVPRRSPAERQGDLDKVMAWMRKGKGKGQKKEDKYDPTGEFRKLDALLPKKKSHTPEQRAREIEGALDWLRCGGADPASDNALPVLESVHTLPIGRRSPEERAKDYQDALNWVRSNGTNNSLYDPSGEFRKLDGMMPRKKGLTPEERAIEIEKQLDWFRGQKVPDDDPVESTLDMSKVSTLPICKRSPEERAKDLTGAMKWIRNKKKDKYDPTGEFKKLDQLIPRKKGQEPSDRARLIESVLDWSRNQGVSLEDPGFPGLFKKTGQAPFSRRTPEQRARDLADTMNWLRNKGKDDMTSDPTGDFRRLDGILQRSKGQTPEGRARQIEGALDWIRGETEVEHPQPKTIGLLPLSTRSPEQRLDDLDNVLNYLRNKGSKKDKKYDPTGDFKKLDKLLPKKKGGSEEDRARDIEGALDWMRDNNVKPGDVAPLEKFKKLGTIPVSRRTPEQRAKDLSDAMNWTRKKGKNDDGTDPTGDFRKLDSVLPVKKNQTPEDRARELEGALDWIRTSAAKPAGNEDEPLATRLATLPVVLRTPEERKKELNGIMKWLRNGRRAVDDPTREFQKVDQMLPSRRGESPEDRARDLEAALDWMRNHGVPPSSLDDMDAFKKTNSSPVSGRTPEQRGKDLESALNWLRNKGTNDDVLDPTGEFRRLDNSLPKKRKQSPEERARQIESAIDWGRQKDVNPSFNAPLPNLKKTDTVPLCRRTPEERSNDLEDVLNWVRNGRKPSDDQTGDFGKIDQVLPRRIGQTPEQRSREIEAALDWTRNNNVPLTEEALERFRAVGTAPVTGRTLEQRKKDSADALNWLRNKGLNDDLLDPTGEFRKLDASLPKRRKQTLEQRAGDIEGALDWARTQSANPRDSLPPFSEVGTSQIARRSPEERKKVLDDALSWVRNRGNPDLDLAGDFRTIESKLPIRQNQSPEERAREIEGALDWMRNQGLSSNGIDKLQGFKDVGTIPMARRTPEQRKRDLSDCLNWMRHKGEDDDRYDPTGEFRKLDSMLPARRNQGPEARAQDIEGALDWLRDSREGSVPEDIAASFDKVGSLGVSSRTPEQRKGDLESISNWIRNGKLTSDDPSGEFERIDRFLPRKTQSDEDRARDIENAMDWIRSNGASPESTDAMSQFEKIGNLPMARRTPEQRKKDANDIVNWLRNRGNNDALLDPTGEFRKVDSMLPVKKGTSLQQRATQIESCLDWIRQKTLQMPLEQSTPLKRPTVEPISRRSPEQRKGDLDDALAWIRGGKSPSDDTSGEFQKVDQLLPHKRGQSPEDRARDIEGALDWMRNNGLALDDAETIDQFKNSNTIPMSRRTPEQRSKDLESALNWLRNKGNTDDVNDNLFKKIDGMIPQRRNQSLSDRARAIEGCLDWMRNNDVAVDSGNLPDLTKLGAIPVSRRSPEERKQDQSDILQWLRNGQNTDLDPSGDFDIINQMLPSKPGQSPESRAREIESALDWCRNKGLPPSGMDETIPGFSVAGTLPFSQRSPEDRQKDLENALTWLRNGKHDGDDVDGEFKSVDQMLPRRKGQDPVDRARDIESALDWMRNNGVGVVGGDSQVPGFDRLGGIPTTRKTPEQRAKDLNDVLNWMRNGKSDNEDPAGDFNRIDQMLPKKRGQTPRDRAVEIESHLNWIRNNGVIAMDDDDSMEPHAMIGSLPVSRRSPEDRKNDLNDVLNWLRNGSKASEDPTGDFKRVDQMLPTKSGQSLTDRARDIESALDWIRNKDVPMVDGETPGFDKVSAVPISRRTPQERTKDIEDVLSWMRSGKPSSADPSGDFAKVDQMLPTKSKQPPAERARDIEGALDWMRNNGVSPEEMTLVPGFNMMESIPLSKRSPEDRQKDVDDVMTWLRNGMKPSDDPSGEFKKLDQMLPRTKNQKPKDRAQEIEGALDWCRNRGVTPVDAEEDLPFSKSVGSFPVSRKSPEERKKDVDAINTWLRNGKRPSDDETGDFKRVDQLLPQRHGQTPDQRARDIEGALDWMRNSGVKPDDSAPAERFVKMDTMPVDKRSPEERSKDLEAMLNWLRNGKDDVDDVNGDFNRVDQLLPKRENQSPLERANDLDLALNWIRNKDESPFADGDTPGFSKLGSVPLSRRGPEDRARDLDAVLTWLRSDGDASRDPTGDFKRIDQMLPQRGAKNPEERARDIENALDWLRNNGLEPTVDDEPLPELAGSIPISRRSPEDRLKEIDDVLCWLRNGQPEDEGSANDFNRVNQMLPTRYNQPLTDRAREIEGVLDWMRNAGVKPFGGDDVVVSASNAQDSLRKEHTGSFTRGKSRNLAASGYYKAVGGRFAGGLSPVAALV